MGELWGILVRLIATLLAGFYAVIPNYGAAIILLTAVVNVVLLPLTVKQLRSTKKMRQIQPRLKELRSEWGHDRQRLTQKTAELYQSEGVHPAGGCLPSLIQFPVWIALYRVLRNSVGTVPMASALHAALEAGRTWFLGVNLLVAPKVAWDAGIGGALPYLALMAALLGVGMAQQRRAGRASIPAASTDTGSSSRVMPAMLKLMPAFFVFVSWRMPAGLLLYWVTSQSIRVGTQVAALSDEDSGVAEGAPTEASPGESSELDAASEGTPSSGEGQVGAQPRSKKRGRRRK